MKRLIIYGEASKKTIKTIEVLVRDYDTTLMDFLLKNGIPVASSCGGAGVCQKCMVLINQQKALSCQKTIRDFFEKSDLSTMSFSYL